MGETGTPRSNRLIPRISHQGARYGGPLACQASYPQSGIRNWTLRGVYDGGSDTASTSTTPAGTGDAPSRRMASFMDNEAFFQSFAASGALKTPLPSALLPFAKQAIAEGQRWIRFPIPRRTKFGVRFVRLSGAWEGTVVNAVGHRTISDPDSFGDSIGTEVCVVETHPLTVIEAARREWARETYAVDQPVPANVVRPQTRFRTVR